MSLSHEPIRCIHQAHGGGRCRFPRLDVLFLLHYRIVIIIMLLLLLVLLWLWSATLVIIICHVVWLGREREIPKMNHHEKTKWPHATDLVLAMAAVATELHRVVLPILVVEYHYDLLRLFDMD
jgi:Flp pilus assembly protein TadB